MIVSQGGGGGVGASYQFSDIYSRCEMLSSSRNYSGYFAKQNIYKRSLLLIHKILNFNLKWSYL